MRATERERGIGREEERGIERRRERGVERKRGGERGDSERNRGREG